MKMKPSCHIYKRYDVQRAFFLIHELCIAAVLMQWIHLRLHGSPNRLRSVYTCFCHEIQCLYSFFFFFVPVKEMIFFIYLKCWYDSTLEINDALNRFSQPKQRLDEMKLCYSSIIFTNIKSGYFFLSNIVCRPLISNITSFACICNTRYSLSA